MATPALEGLLYLPEVLLLRRDWDERTHKGSVLTNQVLVAGRWSYDIMVMGNGALAGLVAITAPCSTVYPWGAIVVGIVAGMVYNFGSWVSVKLHVSRWFALYLAICIHGCSQVGTFDLLACPSSKT